MSKRTKKKGPKKKSPTKDLNKKIIATLLTPGRYAATLAPSQKVVIALDTNSKEESLTINFRVAVGKQQKGVDEKGNKTYKYEGQDLTLTLELEPYGDRGHRKVKAWILVPKTGYTGNKASGLSGKTHLKVIIVEERKNGPSLVSEKSPIEIPITNYGPRDRVKITISKLPGRKKDKPAKTFEFLCRYMTPKDKFVEFLEWQYQLIYGPPKYWYEDGVYKCRMNWKPKPLEGVPPFLVSASGQKGHGCVCSPMAATFLGYWLNYQKQSSKPPRGLDFRFRAGDSMPEIKKAYCKTEFVDDGVGQALKARGDARLLALPKELSTLETEIKQEKNKKEITQEENKKEKNKKKRNINKIKIIALNKKIKALKKNIKKVKKEIDKRELGMTCSWSDFLTYLERSHPRNGEIFVCSEFGTHVWLVVKLGGEFTVPKKFIFGKGPMGDKDSSSGTGWYDQLCPPGWYLIQANGPSCPDANIIFSKKIPTGKFQERMIDKLEKDTFTRKPPKGVNYSALGGRYSNSEKYADVIDELKKGLTEAKSKGEELIKVFRGTPLVWMNGRLHLEDGSVKIAFAIDDEGNEIKRPKTEIYFEAFCLRDVLDPKTGWVKEEYAPPGTSLETFDCRPLEWTS